MNKLLKMIITHIPKLLLLVAITTTQELYACADFYHNPKAYSSCSLYDCREGENKWDSLYEWNKRHTGNYIQKVNDDFYVIPNTPHSIQIREISDTMKELDVQ